MRRYLRRYYQRHESSRVVSRNPLELEWVRRLRIAVASPSASLIHLLASLRGPRLGGPLHECTGTLEQLLACPRHETQREARVRVCECPVGIEQHQELEQAC
jgi:hypothetical protein